VRRTCGAALERQGSSAAMELRPSSAVSPEDAAKSAPLSAALGVRSPGRQAP
jgi:hypothetical protein